jgi:hypothetical protein
MAYSSFIFSELHFFMTVVMCVNAYPHNFCHDSVKQYD